jgi:hypothetical protein
MLKTADGQPVTKKGRPFSELKEKNPEAYALEAKINGGVDTVKRLMKARVTEADIMNEIKDSVKDAPKEIRKQLHEHLVNKQAARQTQVVSEREKLKSVFDSITITGEQRELIREMREMNKKELEDVRMFYLAAVSNVNFLLLASSKANPHFETEELICRTFDDIERATTEHLFTLPSNALGARAGGGRAAPQSQDWEQWEYDNEVRVGSSASSVAGTDTTDIN